MNTRLYARMRLLSPSDVISTFVAWRRDMANRHKSGTSAMVAAGYAPIECDAGVTEDGRDVVEAYGQRWALRKDIHDDRLQKAIEDAQARADGARQAEANRVAEGIAATACPQMRQGKPCGGALNRKGVCPSCVTGKMGYRYRYTCESCGCDIVTREELR